MTKEDIMTPKEVEVDPFSGDFYAATPTTFLRNFEKGIANAQRIGTHQFTVPCGSCSICCKSGYHISLSASEIDLFPDAIIDETTSQPRLPFALDGKTCIKYTDGKCSIYENRPNICRGYDCRILFFAGIIPAAYGNNDELSDFVSRRIYTTFKTPQDKMVWRILRHTAQVLVAQSQSMPYPEIGRLASVDVETVSKSLNTPEGTALLSINMVLKNFALYERLIKLADIMPEETKTKFVTLASLQSQPRR